VSTWYTYDEAKGDWPDLPTGKEGADLLVAARIQCEAFAPAPEPGSRSIPETYRMAHLMQAKAIRQAQTTGGSSTSGDLEAGGQTVRVFPMDWQVKQLLRPTRGLPVVG